MTSKSEAFIQSKYGKIRTRKSSIFDHFLQTDNEPDTTIKSENVAQYLGF